MYHGCLLLSPLQSNFFLLNLLRPSRHHNRILSLLHHRPSLTPRSITRELCSRWRRDRPVALCKPYAHLKCICSGRLTFTSTKTNQLRSPFLRLPAELRNRIYGYTLAYGTLEVPSWSQWGQLPLLDVGLLRTCRQIHAETTMLFYSLNTFRLNNNMDLVTLTACLNAEKRSVIRRLDLNLRAALAINDAMRHGCGCPKLRLFPSLESIHIWGQAPEEIRHAINTALRFGTLNMGLRITWVAACYDMWNKSSGWAGSD